MRPRLKILCYHSITAEPVGDKWSVPRARFAAQMRRLAEGPAAVVPLIQAVARLREGRGHDRMVALTFDDGYLDNLEHAFPVLWELGLPATLFITVAEVGLGRGAWGAGVRPRLTWDEIRQCAQAGVAVGVHGMTHRVLTGLPDMDLREELVGAHAVIAQELGRPPTPAFAYAHGRADTRVRRSARAAGYECGLGASSPLACTPRSDPWYLRRETVYGDTSDWAFAAKVEPRWDRARACYWFPARCALQALRRPSASSPPDQARPRRKEQAR